VETAGVNTCPACGAAVGPLLSCPRCLRLVHSQTLNRLAAEAYQNEAALNPTEALRLWREALDLLPPDSQQHAKVREKVAALSREVDSLPAGATGHHKPQASTAGKGAAAAGGIALLFWKFKFILVLILTKAKFLILGVTKAGTFFSMILSLGVYWAAFGWAFALGLVLSIYVHEMGHVAALRRFGFKTSLPMFIPGLGAVIRLRQHPIDPREDARIGLAGPIWGAFAAAAAYGLGLWLHQPMLLASARVGAWINLFNLLPVWQLDGSRGFRALSRAQAWFIVLVMAGMCLATGEGLLVLICIVAIMRAAAIAPSAAADRVAFVQFAGLVIVLSLMSRIPIPGHALP
jgi:Zn-dependent protease